MHDEKLEITYTDPHRLHPNPWNTNTVDPENETRLDNAIERLGMFKPILVRTLPDDTLQMLGGQHRAESAQRKGFKGVPIVNLGRVDDTKAKEIGLADNGRYGHDDAVLLAELLQSLGSHDEITSFLPYCDAELNSIFDAASIVIDDLDLSADDEEIITVATSSVQTHQMMRFKVPVEDAPAIESAIEQIMRVQGFCASDSLINAGDALVFLVRGEGMQV